MARSGPQADDRQGRPSGRRATDVDTRFAVHAAPPDRLPEEHHQCPILPSTAAESGVLTVTSQLSLSAAGPDPRGPAWARWTAPTRCGKETAGLPGISPPPVSAGAGRTRTGWSPSWPQ